MNYRKHSETMFFTTLVVVGGVHTLLLHSLAGRLAAVNARCARLEARVAAIHPVNNIAYKKIYTGLTKINGPVTFDVPPGVKAFHVYDMRGKAPTHK